MEMTSVPKNYYQYGVLVVYSRHAQKSTPLRKVFAEGLKHIYRLFSRAWTQSAFR